MNVEQQVSKVTCMDIKEREREREREREDQGG